MFEAFKDFINGETVDDNGSNGDDSVEKTSHSDEEVLDNPEEINQGLVSAENALKDTNKARIGNHWVKSMFVWKWPEEPEDGFFHSAANTPNTPSDISMHINPVETRQAISEMEEIVRELEKQASNETDFLAAQERSKEYQDAQTMLNVLEDTNTELFEVSMYLLARAENKSDLNDAVDELQTKFEGSPALLDIITASFNQEKGIQSTSPIAQDTLKPKQDSISQKMMGGAVAASMMWTSPTIVEDKGVEFGLQAHNGAPVIVDRFSRGNGYNQFTVGKIGSGKSFSTKLNMLRTYSQRRDTVIFMLDPLEGFQHIVRRLQGKHVIVGGNEAFNPMEIRPPSSDIEPEVLNKMNPLKQKIESVMGFLETYFKQQGHELGERREVLSTAVNKAYEQANITPDPETHTNTSPTLRDVIGILKRIANDPEAAALSTSKVEVQKFEEDAAELLVGLRPFMEGREFSNLGTHTSVDLSADIVYIDLRQQEASGSPGMMMQLLFEQVYQRAKETSKNVMFAIDEAHMIIKDAESLDFLEQAIRHSRHYNLSINFITQTVDEFFQKEQAATIASQCSIKLLHKVKQMNEESARKLELSPIEIEYVKNAKTGEESPYSEALIGVGRHGYIPIQVHALEAEAMIIDYEGYLEEEREMDIEVQGEAEDLDLE